MARLWTAGLALICHYRRVLPSAKMGLPEVTWARCPRSAIANDSTLNERQVSDKSANLRVAYPEDFPSSTLIGPFLNRCRQRLGQRNQLLDQGSVNKLRALKDYGNNFDHDANPAWQT